MKRRFEFQEGGSSKFWQVSVEGVDMTVTYGRIGTSGQTKTKSFASELLAKKEADKLVTEKTKKGYVEVGSQPGAPTGAKTSAKTSAKAATAGEPPTSTEPVGQTHASEAASVTPVEAGGIRFSPPAWTAELAEPTLEDRMRPDEAPPFEKLWGHLFEANRRWSHAQASGARWPAGDAGHSPPARDLIRRVRGRLATAAMGEGFDVDLEAATFALAVHGRGAPRMTVLWHWASRTDPPTALRTFFRAHRFGFADGDEIVLRTPDEDVAPQVFDRRNLLPMRWLLRAYDQEPLLAVVREEWNPTSLWERADRAWLLDDREDAARLWVDAGRTASRELVQIAPLLDDVEGVRALLKLTYDGPLILRTVRRIGLPLATTAFEIAARRDLEAKQLIALLACFPSAEAARLLVSLLDEKATRKRVADTLAEMPEHAISALRESLRKKPKYRDFAEALLQSMTREAAPAVQELGEEAAADALPQVLATPPWRARTQKKSAARTFEGLTPRAIEPVIDLSNIDPVHLEAGRKKVRQASRFPVEGLVTRKYAIFANDVFHGRSLDEIRKLHEAGVTSRVYPAGVGYQDAALIPALFELHGLELLPIVLAALEGYSPWHQVHLGVVGAVEIAPLALTWMGRKQQRSGAEAWARRHPRHAAVALLPVALGKPGLLADRALHLLMVASRAGHREVILDEARVHGDEVERAVRELLDRDPLDVVPSKPPKLFDGLDLLPRPTLRDGRVLSPDATRVLLEMLAFSPMDVPYPGIAQVREACAPASLDRFACALVQAWNAAGMPSAHNWAVQAAALIGTDASARFVDERVRAWAADGSKARAMLGLEVLAAMGSDLALSLVGRVSRSGAKQYLKDRATEILAEIAEARGLTADELEDRTAPDLGLDEHGTMTLDFGTRSFRVGFDEHLMPFVRDADGKRLDALPRAAKSDDKEKAAAAWATWKALRSEAEKVAKDQVARLERMMGDERKVAPDIFLDAFVKHPLVSHLARRLVWGAWNAARELTATFRVSEDGSFATIEDESFELPADVEVGVVHPMALPADAVMKWSELFASYELVQPFGQLARRRDPIGDDELLAAISGRQAPSGLLYGLRAHGWRAEADYDGVTGYRKVAGVAGEVSFFLALDPPLKSGEKSMHRLSLSKYQGGTRPASAVQLVEIAHQLENVLE